MAVIVAWCTADSLCRVSSYSQVTIQLGHVQLVILKNSSVRQLASHDTWDWMSGQTIPTSAPHT